MTYDKFESTFLKALTLSVMAIAFTYITGGVCWQFMKGWFV